MRHVSINGKPVGQQPDGNVISRSAILILSGFLIGTAIASGHPTGVTFCGFCAGVIGMLSFYVLDLAAERRRNRVVRRKLAAADSTLTNRLQRHVATASPKPPQRRPSRAMADYSSYMPVMFAGGR